MHILNKFNIESPKSLLFIATFTLLLVIQFYAGIVPAWMEVRSDFPNYYTASRIIIEGNNTDKIYNDQWFNSKIHEFGIKEQGKFSPFPPATAFLMIPFAGFEPITAKRLWTIANLILLILIIVLLNRIISWKYTWLIIFVLLGGINLANNILFGQFYIALLFLIILSYYLWQKNLSIPAGIIIGFAASVKYFPIIFLIPYAIQKKYTIVWSAIITIVLISILEILFFDWEIYTQYIYDVLIPHLGGNLSGQSTYATAFQSWNSLFSRLFIPHPGENPFPVFSWPLGFSIFKTVVHLIISGLAIYTIIRVNKNLPSHSLELQLAICGITTIVLLPASATYHFILLIFPVILLLKDDTIVISDIARWILIGNYALIGFIPLIFPSNVPLKGLSILLAYPRLWFVTILFFISIWLVNRLITVNVNRFEKTI
jgi:hypothetical protein